MLHLVIPSQQQLAQGFWYAFKYFKFVHQPDTIHTFYTVEPNEGPNDLLSSTGHVPYSTFFSQI